MKRTLLYLLVGATLTLSAQEGTAWVAGYAGMTSFDTDARINTFTQKDQLHYGAGIGHWYTNRWGIDLRALTNDLELNGPVARKSQQAHLLLAGLFNLRPGASNWYPYLAAGLGGTVVGGGQSPSGDKTFRFNTHIGAGLMGRVADNVLLDLSAKAVRVELPKPRTEYLATLGLGYTWGGARKAAPVAAPAPTPAPTPAPAPKPEPKAAPAPPPPAPEPVKEIAKPVPPPPPPPPPAKIVLDEAVLHFANGKSELGAAATAAIQKVADGLKAYRGDYTLEVSGHTSSVGGQALNKALSKRRADAVAKVLVASGIPAAKVTTVGAGPDKPIADNKTKEGQAKNRRVEIDVKVKDAKVDVRTITTGTVESNPK